MPNVPPSRVRKNSVASTSKGSMAATTAAISSAENTFGREKKPSWSYWFACSVVTKRYGGDGIRQ
jgi:hypothetical protein